MIRLSATRRVLLVGVAVGAVLASGAFAADKPTMGVVVKIGGIPWFNAMETGIKEVAPKTASTPP
jgi:simple sugar transport system substrate-binding protein